MARLRNLALVAALVALLSALTPTGAAAQANNEAVGRIVVVPDSQVLTQTEAGGAIIAAQFDWIEAQAAASNTVFVTHVGDVVQNPNTQAEWDRIEPEFADFEAAGIPFGMAPGNHDLVNGGGPVLYDTLFPLSRYEAHPWFGGAHAAEGTRSTWQTTQLGPHQLLFLHIRHLPETYGDVANLLAWADGVLAAHPDHLTFVTTHEFTNNLGVVLYPALQDVIDDHCSVVAVFSGHRGTTGLGTFDDACGRTVHHMLTNYQFDGNGGNGYTRLLDVDPSDLSVTSTVYSPYLDDYHTGPEEAFTFQLAPLPVAEGDASCDGSMDIVDALAISQFTVQIRTERTICPLFDPATEINTDAADVNLDGTTDIVDALLIAQCTVSIANVVCPAA